MRRTNVTLDTDNIRDVLKTRLPAVSKIGGTDLWIQSPPDNYGVFGEALRPHVFSLLRSPENEKELRETFAFLEDVAREGSTALLDVLQLEILVPLGRSGPERGVALKHMGPELRELFTVATKRSLRRWLATQLSRLSRR